MCVVKSNNKKQGCVSINQSQTVTSFTELDALHTRYLTLNRLFISWYSVFATHDLKSAYHQVHICEHDKHFAAYQANDRLWKCNRIPFGDNNGGPVFQRQWIILLRPINCVILLCILTMLLLGRLMMIHKLKPLLVFLRL